jgi:two-component system chemotaxis response regulator CheB
LVDDSAAYRGALALALSRDKSLRVVGEAGDGAAALQLVETLCPDVVLLDLMMPRLNGIETARAILRDHGHQTSVLLLSALARLPGSIEHRQAVAALPPGVVALYDKPTLVGPDASVETLIRRIKQAQIERRLQPHGAAVPSLVPPRAASVIVVAASTGGIDALRHVLEALPATAPPVVIAQHMAPDSVTRFAQQLKSHLAADVVAVSDTAELQPGTVFVTARHAHILVRADQVVVRDAAPNELAASADRLFLSAAASHGASALGLVLTGMGEDGARGLLALREAGGWTIAQDDRSSLVYGMPRAAAEAGACKEVLSLHEITQRLSLLSLLPLTDARG